MRSEDCTCVGVGEEDVGNGNHLENSGNEAESSKVSVSPSRQGQWILRGVWSKVSLEPRAALVVGPLLQLEVLLPLAIVSTSHKS